MTKKITAFILVMVMALTMVPAMAFAEGDVPGDGGQGYQDDQQPGDQGDQNDQGDQGDQNDQGDQDQNNNEKDQDDQIEKKDPKENTVVTVGRSKKILKKWGGSVTGINKGKSAGKITVPYGKTRVFHITEKKGFKISKIVVNGKRTGIKKNISITGNGHKQSIKVYFKKAGISIMLDAGHAGHYNRGIIKRYYESVMTWRLTRYLKEELEEYGIICNMTKRSLYHDPGVYNRGKMAKGHDLFISIHSNWSGSSRTDYPLAIVSSKYKKKLYKQAQPLGKKLVKKIKKTMKTRQRYQVWIKRQSDGRDWYGVIRGAARYNVPGIILEHSFHSNRSKCRWLMNKANLKKMAQAEAAVIADHYGYTK